MNTKTKKARKFLWLKILLIVILILAVLLIGISNYLVTYAIGKSGDGGNREVALDVETDLTDTEQTIADHRAEQEALTTKFQNSVTSQTTSITSNDGLTLDAEYFTQETESSKWVILVHGYRADRSMMYNYAQRYYDAGYQVLIPDLRACGESEGDYVGMGWLDKDDILLWIDWVLDYASDTDTSIVLHGVSMGAATVMMTSGEETPDEVVAFVEDCGYTSVWDIFSSELNLRFHLPEFPILYGASAAAKLRAGYSFTEASALNQVKNCGKPMLFIHGTADDFVPFEMQDILYEAKPGDNKEKLVAEGAGHGEASALLGDAYWDAVFTFIQTYE